MCGRTACALDPAILQKACSYKDKRSKKYKKPKWRPHPEQKMIEGSSSSSKRLDVKYYQSFNIYPTKFTPIMFKDQGSQRGNIVLQSALWKLVPLWHKGHPTGHKWSTFNCRIEGLPTSKMFKPALVRKRTCVIPVQGFFEWKTVDDGQSYKQPYFICMSQGKKYGLDEVVNSQQKSWKKGKWNGISGWKGPKMMMLAGLYNVWRGTGGELIYSYTIITKSSNQQVSPIHSRMPVILRPEQISAWLNPKEDASVEEMIKILERQAPRLTLFPVSKKINNARCNYEGCIEKIDLKRKGTKREFKDEGLIDSGEVETKRSKCD